MRRFLFCCLAWIGASLVVDVSPVLAVDPNPLENAYWRFEEGPAGEIVPPGEDNVLDSANENHMRAFNEDTSPTYTTTVAPFPLRSGLPNNLALQFTPHPGGGDDLFTVDQNINNGILEEGEGFTLEAAFRPDSLDDFQAMVAKEGFPGGGVLPTLALKARGDNNHLHIEQFDKAGNLVGVQSTAPLNAGQWYAAAVVNDGSLLSLYMMSEGQFEYVLQGSVPVDGALYQGGTDDDWNHNWAIGRAVFGGDPADWFDGIIDEVRLTNRALSPSEFLFVPEPHSVVLAAFVLAGLGLRRGGRGKPVR